ncbi:hypothetical protein BDB00DRAFT_867502 [Zychaea mexicana]|uniref:uncharacterized protein n=1 Tax=Zychaea mexicana TaxID=64656 RepID=UPI0022FE991C|nr:uncharacterized protein BDB00DRAFT_867502 [Zychaea mexicana]KAI9498341.1 hypothetical protein BDB00DRAFT_867502 [Zychaea mexicana]
MSSTPSTPASTPPSVDFRNATIENHWNDPPHTIFKKASGEQLDKESSQDEIAEALTTVLNHCQPVFTSGPNKRVYADTAQRINGMLKEIENDEIFPHVMQSLAGLSKALETKDWETAKEIHTKLMTTEYEKHGGWLLGLKRLIDLYNKASS